LPRDRRSGRKLLQSSLIGDVGFSVAGLDETERSTHTFVPYWRKWLYCKRYSPTIAIPSGRRRRAV
jgi:hypothetical protein